MIFIEFMKNIKNAIYESYDLHRGYEEHNVCYVKEL